MVEPVLMTADEFLGAAFECEGTEIAVRHSGEAVVLEFSDEQLEIAGAFGLLALTPAAAASLAERLTHRGN